MALPETGEQLLTPVQVAERMQVPLATVYAWSTRKTGPRFIKVGRHLRVRPSDLEAWLSRESA